MKRTKAAQRVKDLADTYYLLAEIADEEKDHSAVVAYQYAARIAEREAYKIEEHL